jgi:hypothetical protein
VNICTRLKLSLRQTNRGIAIVPIIFVVSYEFTKGKARLREPVLHVSPSFCKLEHLLAEEWSSKFAFSN